MAKRFQFRLEQVLELRRQIEEVKVRDLAKAKGRLLEIEDALKGHAEQEQGFLASYGDLEKTGGFNSDQAMAYCDYKDWLLRREKDYRRMEKEWAEEVERRRKAAVKASRDTRLLENLKERKKKAYDQVAATEEQKFLDDISSIAFVRRDRARIAQSAGSAETLRR